VLLPEERRVEVLHERELVLQDGYDTSILAMLASLGDDQVVLDIGAGNRRIDDPRVVRMDVVWTPSVEVIGDALALPFRDESVDVVMASAVWEHLRDPFLGAREVWRVLKPGGLVGIDCNFVFPFHGYPAVFFNASAEGMRQLFAAFREIAVEIGPWQGPSYAIEAVLSEYAHGLKPVEPLEFQFLEALAGLQRFPLREFDKRFTTEAALRVTSGVSYIGLKQPRGDDTVVPAPVVEIWRRDAELRRRYPDPAVLLKTVRAPENDTLMAWARNEGARLHPEIAAWFRSLVPFRRA
jgi:SAM-dependent methyltransferase